MKWLRFVPLFRLVIPFSLGIVIAFYYPLPVTDFHKLACIAFIPILLGIHQFRKLHQKFNLRWVFGAVIFLFVLFSSYVYTNSRIELFDPEHFSHQISVSNPQPILGVIISEPDIKKNSIKATVRIEAVKNGSTWEPTIGKCLVYFQKTDSLHFRYGDEIIFQKSPNEISPPANFDEFNYKKYLSHHYIYHQIYLTPKDYVFTGHHPPHPWKEKAIGWRNILLDRYSEFGISGENLAILSALTLGKKESLTDELKSAYSSAGAMHVLAVSGLHVGIIILVLSWFLGWMEKIRHGKYLKAVILFISIWIYAFLTGMSPSVIRAATMFSFVILALNLQKKSNIYNTIALSAFAILLYEPFMLLEVGFQLSYLAVVGIIFFHPLLYNTITFRPWILDQAWNITCVSIAAQLATAPLGLLYFHQFPTLFLLSNLIIIPAAFLLMGVAIAFQFLFFIPFLSVSIAFVLNLIVGFLNYSVLMIEKIPWSQIQGIDISVLEVWLFYILLISLSLWVIQANKRSALLSMGLLVVLIFLQVNEKFQQLHQREITFYATANHVAIEAIHGTSGIFIADSTLITDEQKMQFHIYHHWWKRGFTHIERHMDSDVSSTLVLENTKILRVENVDDISTNTLTDFEPDILYYNARWFSSTTPIITNKNAIHTIVVGSKTTKKAMEQIVQFGANHSISVHQLTQDGALKITLNSEGKPLSRVYPKTSEKAKVESNRTPFSVFFTEHTSF